MSEKRKRTRVIGTGSVLAEKIVTNRDLEKIVDTSDDWIMTRTGIKERRIADDDTSTSDLAVKAASLALKDAKLDPLELDLILVATTSPDMLFPSTACILQDKLGATKAAAFDVSAACAGFLFALSVADQYIGNGTYKKILVVGADTLTKYLDWEDRTTCVLFGDGAGAVVVEASEEGGILSFVLGSEGSGGKYLTMPGGGSRYRINEENVKKKMHCIRMDGKEVFKFAVRVLEGAVKNVLQKSGMGIDDISLLIPHQANVRIIDHALKRLKLSPEKIFVNLDKYGNTSAASVPIALDEAVKAGRIKRGDIVVVTGFGAGLTYGAAVIKW